MGEANSYQLAANSYQLAPMSGFRLTSRVGPAFLRS